MAKKVWTAAARKAFAEKMRAARAAKGGQRTRRAAVHTAKFDRTVRKVKRSLKKYHRKGNAYAIAENALGEKRSIRKAHRRAKNPADKFIIAAREKSGPYFYVTGKTDTMLTTGAAHAHRFATLASARAVANMLARRVPAHYRVTVHRG